MSLSNITMSEVLYILTFISIAWSIIFQIIKPTSLWNGAFFLFDLLWLLICLITNQELMQNRLLSIMIIIFVAGVLFTLLYFIYILLIFTLWNGIKVLRREKFSLSMSLTLMLGIGNLVLIILMILISNNDFPSIVNYFIYEAVIIEGYFVLWFLAMLISMFLYKLHKISRKAKYIIVLGAGLIDGRECTPLLKARINKGIERYWKQVNRGIDAYLIMSGGQGDDELVPESVAMKTYAIEKGIDEHKILCDEESKTTYENMEFSYSLIQQLDPQVEDREVCFITSNYHVFRAADFMRKLGHKSNGEGCKTAGYFLPNALIREYVAILKARPKFHLAVVTILILVPILFELLVLILGITY